MPKSSKKHLNDTAVILQTQLSPGSEGRLRNALKRLAGNLSPSKVAQSPTSGNFKTNTPRQRHLTKVREMDLQISSSIRKVGIFQTTPKSCRNLSAAFNKVAAQKKSFGPYIINKADLKKIPKRSQVPGQNTVMRGKAQAAWDQLLKQADFNQLSPDAPQKLPSSPHWCHLLAFCLLAGKVNTQDKENLASSSAQCNYTMKKYEIALKEWLQNSQQLQQMELMGEAVIYQGSAFAKEIIINIKLTKIDGTTLQTSITFEGTQTQVEDSNVATFCIETMRALMKEESSSSLGMTPKV